jgi:hypothetical protein
VNWVMMPGEYDQLSDEAKALYKIRHEIEMMSNGLYEQAERHHRDSTFGGVILLVAFTIAIISLSFILRH